MVPPTGIRRGGVIARLTLASTEKCALERLAIISASSCLNTAKDRANGRSKVRGRKRPRGLKSALHHLRSALHFAPRREAWRRCGLVIVEKSYPVPTVPAYGAGFLGALQT